MPHDATLLLPVQSDTCALTPPGLEPRVPSPPPPPQRTAVSSSLAGRSGSTAAVLKPSATWRAGDPLSRPDRVHLAASAEAVHASLHDPHGDMNATTAAPHGTNRPGYPTWWPAVTSGSPSKAAAARPQATRKPGGKKQPSAEQLAFEAALYARSREVAAQRAEAAAAAAAAGESGEYRAPRRSVAFEVPLKPGAPPVLLRASDDVAGAPRGMADISVFDLVRPHAAADAAPSAPPAPSDFATASAPAASHTTSGSGGGGGIPAHVAALRKAEAEYQTLLAEARDADAAAAQARAAAASAMAGAHGGASAGQAALDALLSEGATSAPAGGPRAVAEDFFSGPWTRDLLAAPPVPGAASKPQRKSWAQTFPAHGGDAAGGGDEAAMMPASSSTVPLAPRTSGGLNIMADTAAPLPLTHGTQAQHQGGLAASLKAAKWTPADDLAFSDSDSDGGASADSAALAAVLRAARTAAAAAGEAAALTAKSSGAPPVTYGATDVGGPTYTQQAQQQHGGDGLDAHLAAWRATASPQRTDVSGPLRALLDTWRAGQGTTADGWALEDDGLSSSAESQ